jgi:Ni2+-binding GTPase involved in maturation of urease and hydrogenase
VIKTSIIEKAIETEKRHWRKSGNILYDLLSNEARVASRLRDMTERVKTSKVNTAGLCPASAP